MTINLEEEINKYVEYGDDGDIVINWKGIQDIENLPFIDFSFDELYKSILNHLENIGTLSKNPNGNYGLFLGECFVCLNPPRGTLKELEKLFFNREQDAREYKKNRYGDNNFKYKGTNYPVLVIRTEVVK